VGGRVPGYQSDTGQLLRVIIRVNSNSGVDMGPNPQSKRLLVVGRDPLLRKLRAEVLKSRGYSVFPATDHADALTRCKPGAYDAVLVSGEENEKEALDFCEEVRQLNPDQIVIVIARPHVYIPNDACPDEIVQDSHPVELIASVQAALS
jgi:DNA-binding response OmpR family regulator